MRRTAALAGVPVSSHWTECSDNLRAGSASGDLTLSIFIRHILADGYFSPVLVNLEA